MWELGLRTGDRVLLCSDGLSNEVDLGEMAAILRPGRRSRTRRRPRLVEVANEHGGADNITVVVVDVQVGRTWRGAGPGHRCRRGTAASAWSAASRPAIRPSRRRPPSPATPTTGPPQRRMLSGHRRTAGVADPAARRHGRIRAVRPDDTLAPGRAARFRHRETDAGRGRSAQRRVLRGRRLGGSAVPLDHPGPAATAIATIRVARGGDRGAAPATARHPAPGHVPGDRVPAPAGRRSGGRLLRPALVRLRQLEGRRSQGDQVVVTQGQPGGVLWFHPKVVDRTACRRERRDTLGRAAPQVRGPEVVAGTARKTTSSRSPGRPLATTTTTTTTDRRHGSDHHDGRVRPPRHHDHGAVGPMTGARPVSPTAEPASQRRLRARCNPSKTRASTQDATS